jgi:hypothetical protein
MFFGGRMMDDTKPAPGDKLDPSVFRQLCRHYACWHFRVVYTRPTRDERIMRRRECRY